MPTRTKAVQPHMQAPAGGVTGSGSSLSMGKGAGVGSAEWSERERSAGAGSHGLVQGQGDGDVQGTGGKAGELDKMQGTHRVRAASGRVAVAAPAVKQMGSRTSNMALPRRPDLLDLLQPSPLAPESSRQIPARNNFQRLSPSPTKPRSTSQRIPPEGPRRSAPSVQSNRMTRDAYIADALAVPDEMDISRPRSFKQEAGESRLDLPDQGYGSSMPLRKSRSAASRREVGVAGGDTVTENIKARKAGSSSSNRPPEGCQYRSAAITPVNPRNPHAALMAPVQVNTARPSTMVQGPATTRHAPLDRAEQVSGTADHLDVPHMAPLRHSTRREKSQAELDTIQPVLSKPRTLQPSGQTDRQRIRQASNKGGGRGLRVHSHTALLQPHSQPYTCPLQPSVMSDTTLMGRREEVSRLNRTQPRVSVSHMFMI